MVQNINPFCHSVMPRITLVISIVFSNIKAESIKTSVFAFGDTDGNKSLLRYNRFAKTSNDFLRI